MARLALPLITIATLGTASPASASTVDPSGQARPAPAPLTCDGQGVNPATEIRYRTETLIKAPLRAGSQFRWTTPVPETPSTPATTLSITSTQVEADVPTSTAYLGAGLATWLSDLTNAAEAEQCGSPMTV